VKRKIMTYLFFALLLPAVLLAQQPDSTRKSQKIASKDTSTVGKKTALKGAKKAENKQTGFVDKNANGIDDRMEKRGKHGVKKGKTDIFIDRDGDGICDGRESAIGLKKIMRRRHGGKGPM